MSGRLTAAVLAGLLVTATGGANPVLAGSPTPEDEADTGKFDREVYEEEEFESGDGPATGLDEESTGGSADAPPANSGGSGAGVVRPVRVPCTWVPPAAVPQVADILNRITAAVENVLAAVPSRATIELEYYVENRALRRWNGGTDQFEQFEQADCSRARNEPAVATGDVRWSVVVPPAPGVLIPPLRLIVSGQIRPPESRISPAGEAAINLGLWFAVTDNGPIVAEGRLGPLWARGTATLTTTIFDPGNGDAPVSCPGGGTEISNLDTVEQGPCGYTYRSTSDVDDADLDITIRSTWTVTWETSDGNGSADPPETMTRSTVIPYDVYEIQTVGTG